MVAVAGELRAYCLCWVLMPFFFGDLGGGRQGVKRAVLGNYPIGD